MFKTEPRQLARREIRQPWPRHLHDVLIRVNRQRLIASGVALVGAVAVEVRQLRGPRVISAAGFADHQRLGQLGQTVERQAVTEMPGPDRHRPAQILVAVAGNPFARRIKLEAAPAQLSELRITGVPVLLAHLVVIEDGEQLVAEAPAEDGRMIAIAPDHRVVMLREPLPRDWLGEIEFQRAAEQAGLRQHHEAHFVGEILIIGRPGLRVQPDAVATGVLDHPIPRVGVTTRMHSDAERMQNIRDHLKLPAVEQQVATLNSKLSPAESLIARVLHLAVAADGQHKPVEVGRIG